MGLFGDIFEDDDFEISSEEEELELDLEDFDEEDKGDDWGTGQGATWDTGNKPDIWNADEPWTCDDDCADSTCDGGCGSGKKSFDVDDFFS